MARNTARKQVVETPSEGGISGQPSKIEIWPLDKVRPYAKNPRVIPEQAVRKVAASIREYGFQQPIVVDTAGVIIVGHTRLQAAKLLGAIQVPVIVADLPAAKARAYRLADNRTNQETSWDDTVLSGELQALLADGEDLANLGFDSDEIDAIMRGWESDFDPSERDGENLDGIENAIQVIVPNEQMEKAKKLIAEALSRHGVKHELR